ncbi:MAG: PIN domain nuclease [Xanthomonadales bacterium]|nr:PIN domain nuclease [Xanthomonadales bacterium]
MILIDSSAWIEYLRDTGSPVCQRVEDLLKERMATCDVIRMEVLAGARDDHHLQQLRGLLARATNLPVEPVDYEMAAALFRSCRQQGHTVRTLVDCLIAAVAIRAGVPILHRDSDFEVLARHSTLEISLGR